MSSRASYQVKSHPWIAFVQMIEIAKNLSKQLNESEAIRSFQGILRDFSTSYFHDEPLPENETNVEAHKKCVSDETAAIHCPKRWQAMTKWFKFAQMVRILIFRLSIT